MFAEQLRRAVEAAPRVERARVAHPLLPLPRLPSPRRRSSRRPFAPSQAGAYRLPHDVRDRLAAALTPFRNRDAAFALATFLDHGKDSIQKFTQARRPGPAIESGSAARRGAARA